MKTIKVNKNIIASISLLIIIISAIFYFSNYRFTAKDAAEKNFVVNGNLKTIGEIDFKWGKAFLYHDEDNLRFHTVLVNKEGFLYRSNTSIWHIDHEGDPVKTVGSAIISDDNKSLTLLAVETYDANVSYIEAGIEGQRMKKDIFVGKIINFAWPISMWVHEMNAIAFDKNGVPLYRYGFLENDNHMDIKEDLRWHKINNNLVGVWRSSDDMHGTQYEEQIWDFSQDKLRIKTKERTYEGKYEINNDKIIMKLKDETNDMRNGYGIYKTEENKLIIKVNEKEVEDYPKNINEEEGYDILNLVKEK